MVGTRHRLGPQGQGATTDLDDEGLHLGEEVHGQVADGLAQDGLLDQDDRGAGLLDGLADVEDVLPLVPQHAVHLCVVRHDHLVVQLYAMGWS